MDIAEKEAKYDLWFPQKKKLNRRYNLPSFHEGQVWWCRIGVNIGSEILGKGNHFTRPVLIIKKYNDRMFLAAALSTSNLKNRKYVPAHVLVNVGKTRGAVRLDQLRALDAQRLGNFIESLSKQKFEEVRARLRAEF